MLDTGFTCFYFMSMELDLTADQKAFIQQAIDSGRFRNLEDAVYEALSLWEDRERRRSEILVAVDTAEDSLARGEGRSITPQSMRELGAEIKQRGRRRRNADQQTSR